MSNLSDNQKIRKNSIPYYNNGNQTGNKNFTNFANPPPTNLTNFQRSSSREKLNQFTLMQQQHHMQFTQMPPPPPPPQQQGGNSTNSGIYGHRHSLNALMPFAPSQQFVNRRNSSCGTDRMMQQHAEKNVSETTLTSTTSDINSRLESLCRQMTEQAIN